MDDTIILVKPFHEVARLLRENEVGRRTSVETPFGRRLLCYADLTATGRYLHFVEGWVRRLRPYYANTHTSISSTGRIMTELREDARRLIARSVGATSDDAVLFTGSGATAAVNELVGLLGLHRPALADPNDRPLVLVGPYEHHSNTLPWLESSAEVIEVGLDASGGIDLGDLAAQLERHRGRSFVVGAFSAASNVTGVLSDVPAIARLLHRAGALAVFDYAAAAPYVPIAMHPAADDERLDAVVFSTHKFIGGPQASGVLVVARALCKSKIPVRPGGGTVDYVGAVARDAIDYTSRLEERSESGTPAIVGDIRAGVAFLVKEMVGPQRVLAHETALAAHAVERLQRHPRVRLLGPSARARLAILSFNIEGLHHDLVSGLLDHLFGIQNRAGCACAGPYGHRLLGIDQARSARYRRQIAIGNLGVKPGWVRLTVPYYASDEDLEFLLGAVEFVADHGDAFVPAYCLGWSDGVWRHVERPVEAAPPLALTVEALEAAVDGGAPADPEPALSEEQIRAARASYFREAHAAVAALEARWVAAPPRWNPPTGRPDVDDLIWFKYVHAAGTLA